MDSNFLRFLVRTRTVKDKRCLCKKCRASLFFDLMEENNALRAAVEDATLKLRQSAAQGGVPETHRNTVERISLGLLQKIFVDIPRFTRRKEFLVADLEDVTIESLTKDKHIERAEWEQGKGTIWADQVTAGFKKTGTL